MAEFAQSTLDPSFGWWITGLTDGEGCFYANLSFREKATKAGALVPCVELEAQFAIALRADDAATLSKVLAHFKCGKIANKFSSAEAPSRLRQGIKPSPMRRFIVRKPIDLIERVIPHFDSYPLQSKKARDFEIWKQLVFFASSELVGHKGWLRRFPEKVEHLGELCARLKTNRKYVDIDEVRN